MGTHIRGKAVIVVAALAVAAAVAPAPSSARTARPRAERVLHASLSQRLRAAAARAHITPTFDARWKGLPSAELARVDALPGDLRAPVRQLASAVARAQALRDAAFAGRTPQQIAALILASHAHDATLSRTTKHGRTTVSAPNVITLEKQSVHGVNLGALAGGAIVLADAIDQSMPALQRVARSDPTRAAERASAPTVDNCPQFAIDLGGNTTYTEPCSLIIDLGGDDHYLGSEGGTSPALPVSVVIDVTGNDTYTSVNDTASADAQGGGAEGFQSVLNGIESAAPDPNGMLGALRGAQGAGVAGIGVVVDGGGTNSFAATNIRSYPADTTPRPAEIVAQGASDFGVGVLEDLGTDETFDAEAAGVGGSGTTIAQGAGLNGIGLLMHATGAATYRAAATSSWLRVSDDEQVEGQASVYAQGAGASGAGALVDGSGDDTYTIDAHNDGVVLAAGQGAGVVAGAGSLVDGGGSDHYVLDAIGDNTLESDLDGCGIASAITLGGGSAVYGQGSGYLAGAGEAIDLGSEQNTWSAKASLNESDLVRVNGTNCSGNGGEAATKVGTALAEVQGAGNAGSGSLESGTGNDTYSITTSADARADSEVAGASPDFFNLAEAGVADARGQAQAIAGHGSLNDAGGNDAYGFTQSADATIVENGVSQDGAPGELLTSGRAYTFLAGTSAFADAGGQDEYGALPGAPACDVVVVGGGTSCGAPLFAGANDMCWTNSAPDVIEGDPAIGSGMDFDSALPSSCMPPPN